MKSVCVFVLVFVCCVSVTEPRRVVYPEAVAQDAGRTLHRVPLVKPTPESRDVNETVTGVDQSEARDSHVAKRDSEDEDWPVSSKPQGRGLASLILLKVKVLVFKILLVVLAIKKFLIFYTLIWPLLKQKMEEDQHLKEMSQPPAAPPPMYGAPMYEEYSTIMHGAAKSHPETMSMTDSHSMAYRGYVPPKQTDAVPPYAPPKQPDSVPWYTPPKQPDAVPSYAPPTQPPKQSDAAPPYAPAAQPAQTEVTQQQHSMDTDNMHNRMDKYAERVDNMVAKIDIVDYRPRK